jgi:hypothetical protein
MRTNGGCRCLAGDIEDALREMDVDQASRVAGVVARTLRRDIRDAVQAAYERGKAEK